jgi:hypothetical protein
MSVIKQEHLMTSYANFLASQQREDHFSMKLRELYDKKQSVVSDLPEALMKEFEDLIDLLKSKKEDDKNQQITMFLESLKGSNRFPNIMPYILDKSQLDLQISSDFFKMNDIEKSYFQFEKLAKKLFPNVFTDDKKLKAFFISLISYEHINPESIGLYNIDVLEKIFTDNLLNSSSSSAKFEDGLKTYFESDSFGLTYSKLSQLLGKIPGRDRTLLDTNSFFDFDCDLWFEEFDKNRSNFDKNALLHFMGSDSFGSFAFLPNTQDEVYSPIGTFDIANIVHKNKLRCFVFPKVQMAYGGSTDIFSTKESAYSFDKMFLSNLLIKTNCNDIISRNPGFKFFYNATQSTESGSKPSIRFAGSNYELVDYKPLYKQPEVSHEALGGSSKKNKMKGGSFDNLFDMQTAPSVRFTRPLKNYNNASFFTCVTHLKKIGRLEDTKKQIRSLIRQLIQPPLLSKKEPVYPVVYTADTQQSLGSFKLTYSDIRLLFLFSSIFTTFIKLFLYFFSFLNNTYSLIISNYEKMQKEPSEKNKSKNTDYFFNQISKFQNLQKSIVSIIKKLLLLISSAEDISINKFFGFNLMFYRQFLRANNSNADPTSLIESQIIFYESVIDLVCNGLYDSGTDGKTKLALKQNIFHKTLQQFSILFDIDFGGVPLISDKPEVQNSIIESYKFFVRYVYACQKSFIKYVEYHNDERNVKAKKNVIENIDSNVKREIEGLKKSKSTIVEKCKEILKIVLSKFISKLHEIHQIYSRNKNSSTPETRGNNNSNSKNKELKKKLGEFKIHIAIMESSLTDLLNIQSEINGKPKINDKQTLELFMMRRFNNLSSLLEYVILNIKGKKIDALLYPMGIQIDFEKGINKGDTEKLFKKLENEFFTFKPELRKDFGKLLQNTGFYYRNPSFENIEWWVEKMSDFQERNPGKRLFILGTLRRFGITNKIGIDDPVLIDVGSCALVPDGEEIPIKKFLDIDYTIDKKTGKITEMIYKPAKNTIINLTPFLRYIREGYTRFIKKRSVSREYRGTIMKALIKQIEFRNTNASNNTPLSTMGNIIRLFKGKLKNDAGIPISPVILQGKSPNQLVEIITSRILNKKTSNVTLSSNKSRVDYQLIKVDKKNLKNSNLFRNFLSMVLFSSPESYHSEAAALDFNLFNLFQVGLSSTYFTTSRGKGSLVIDIFTALQPDNLASIIEQFQAEMASSTTESNKITTHKKFALEIAEKMKLINQQELQKLLLERATKYVNVNNSRKEKRTNNNEEKNNRSKMQIRTKRLFDFSGNSLEESTPRYEKRSFSKLKLSESSSPLYQHGQTADFSRHESRLSESFPPPYQHGQTADFGRHSQRLMGSVQPYSRAYSSQQNNLSKIRPVEGNVYNYLLQYFTDFISYLQKSIEGKIFLNFLNNLQYSHNFQIISPRSATFTYDDTRIRYYVNYEFRFNENLAILFTNTLGMGRVTYACFCDYNNFRKQFTPIPIYGSGSRTVSSFIASFDNGESVILSLKNIELKKNGNRNPTEALKRNNSNNGKYKFATSGTEV